MDAERARSVESLRHKIELELEEIRAIHMDQLSLKAGADGALAMPEVFMELDAAVGDSSGGVREAALAPSGSPDG